MILTTTNRLDGMKVTQYLGVISSEAIMGANIMRDFMAGITDIVGGRSSAYEEKLRQAQDIVLGELKDRAASMGANAVIGIDLDYETVGQNGSMLMVTASGTAVVAK